MTVYDVVPRDLIRQTGGKLIDTRWIDTNKADEENPEYRSRLVGREFKTETDDSLYASTPPLESLRVVLSWASTVQVENCFHEHEVMINDVRRAYFYAKASRNLFIELPDEDARKEPGVVGRLNLCLYGTRDAARSWQQTLTDHLVKIGFTKGVGHISVFHHVERGIKTLVHGDDYFSAGPKASLDWMEQQLSEAYEIKTQRVCGRNGCSKEGKVLNRIVRWTPTGHELEGDPRHAELVVEQLGLSDASSLSSPGIDLPDPEPGSDEDQELDKEKARLYRGIAARCNYLSADRPELQFAVKEACREMSRPTVFSWAKLVRIGRYLKGQPRLVWKYDLQAQVKVIDVYSDANWAACRRTRKSTSGGIAIIGSHVIKSWSKTQSVIAKSSAESELYAIIRASTEALGMVTLYKDMGSDVKIRVHVDATAAKSIVERQGLGKVRHVEVDLLWIQDQQLRNKLPLIKVDGKLNPSYLMTKHLSRSEIIKNLELIGHIEMEGRSDRAAKLHSLSIGANGILMDCWPRMESRLVTLMLGNLVE